MVMIVGMGYVFITSACVGCRRIFSYNPMHVPSIPANISPTGTREPICRDCVELANPRRIKNGLAPIVPHPEAYEACPEDEMNWG
jgi:hypothetical protein